MMVAEEYATGYPRRQQEEKGLEYLGDIKFLMRCRQEVCMKKIFTNEAYMIYGWDKATLFAINLKDGN